MTSQCKECQNKNTTSWNSWKVYSIIVLLSMPNMTANKLRLSCARHAKSRDHGAICHKRLEDRWIFENFPIKSLVVRHWAVHTFSPWRFVKKGTASVLATADVTHASDDDQRVTAHKKLREFVWISVIYQGIVRDFFNQYKKKKEKQKNNKKIKINKLKADWIREVLWRILKSCAPSE